MSITVNQLLLDAQRLANRLKSLDTISNSLLVDAESNNKQLEAMKQFQEDIDSLNKLSRNMSNTEMISRINQQNPTIREIRQENRELKASLEDHQRVLEIIMQKYREHTGDKLAVSHINFTAVYSSKISELIKLQCDKINHLDALIRKAAFLDDELINAEMENLKRLQTENEGLREMLQISNQFGSLTFNASIEDKAIQADVGESCNLNINENNNKHTQNDTNANEMTDEVVEFYGS